MRTSAAAGHPHIAASRPRMEGAQIDFPSLSMSEDTDARELQQPIMTSTALYTTLGGLVNEVLLRVLDEIEEQTDISEEESIRLNKLSKMLHDLEGLFDGSEVRIRVLMCFSSRRF